MEKKLQIKTEYIIQPQTKQLLISLAQKYEVPAFTNEDPSQFIRWYSFPADVEPACFIAAMLSFGNRKQFIPKIRQIFELADKAGGMALWLKSGQYKCDFEQSDRKFYRFYSYSDMLDLFSALEQILQEHSTLGEAIYAFCKSSSLLQAPTAKNDDDKTLMLVLQFFQTRFANASIVPKGKTSANKRIFMFLRWMVRKNSPVDLGLWTWFPPSQLIIPLDVHVLQEAKKLELIPPTAPASFKTAQLLTNRLKQIWPQDPCKGDFALFGVGVDYEKDNVQK